MQNEKFSSQNEKFEQKFEVMLQAFMERSNDTKDTVSSVEGRVKSIEQAADTTYRHVDDTETRFHKKMESLKHEKGIRERKDADLKETQETLTTRVETAGKSLTTFKKEQTVDGYSETELHEPRWT